MNPANFTYSIAWTDFTEKDTSPSPPREAFTTADAKTPSSIKFTKDSNSKFIVDPSKFNVSLTMNVTNSWVVNGKQTNALLNHEQGHYNLTALSARDMLNDMLALTADTPAELGKALSTVQTNLQAELKSMNKMYDEDPNCGTDHGNKAGKQAQWDLRINNAMNSSTDRLSSLASCPAPPAAAAAPSTP